MSVESVVSRMALLQSAFAPAPPSPPATNTAPKTAAPFQQALRDALAPGPSAPVGTAPPTAAAATGSGLTKPVDAPVTSGFGPRWGRAHSGVDLGAPLGAPVQAAAGGQVKSSGPAGAYGNLVVIEHPDGTETRYAHLSSLAVRPGDVVARGQSVGQVGSTGRSTGPHLHFEVRVAGQAVDPLTRLSR